MKIEKVESNYCNDCKKSVPYPEHFDAFKIESENLEVEESMVLCEDCLTKLDNGIQIIKDLNNQQKVLREVCENYEPILGKVIDEMNRRKSERIFKIILLPIFGLLTFGIKFLIESLTWIDWSENPILFSIINPYPIIFLMLYISTYLVIIKVLKRNPINPRRIIRKMQWKNFLTKLRHRRINKAIDSNVCSDCGTELIILPNRKYCPNCPKYFEQVDLDTCEKIDDGPGIVFPREGEIHLSEEGSKRFYEIINEKQKEKEIDLDKVRTDLQSSYDEMQKKDEARFNEWSKMSDNCNERSFVVICVNQENPNYGFIRSCDYALCPKLKKEELKE